MSGNSPVTDGTRARTLTHAHTHTERRKKGGFGGMKDRERERTRKRGRLVGGAEVGRQPSPSIHFSSHLPACCFFLHAERGREVLERTFRVCANLSLDFERLWPFQTFAAIGMRSRSARFGLGSSTICNPGLRATFITYASLAPARLLVCLWPCLIALSHVFGLSQRLAKQTTGSQDVKGMEISVAGQHAAGWKLRSTDGAFCVPLEEPTYLDSCSIASIDNPASIVLVCPWAVQPQGMHVRQLDGPTMEYLRSSTFTSSVFAATPSLNRYLGKIYIPGGSSTYLADRLFDPVLPQAHPPKGIRM